jgi:hypothetical protein
MKKCLIIMHGLPRPSLAEVKENCDNLINNISINNENVSFTTLFSSWISNNNLENKNYSLDLNFINSNFDHSLIDLQLELKHLLSFFNPTNNCLNDKLIVATCGYYHLYKKMILICQLFLNFDYYVYCRTDLKIKIKIEDEISFNLPRCYWIENGNNHRFLNDHFFIASNEIFKNIFSNLTIQEVSNLALGAHNPEELLKKVIASKIKKIKIINNVTQYKVKKQDNSFYMDII